MGANYDTGITAAGREVSEATLQRYLSAFDAPERQVLVRELKAGGRRREEALRKVLHNAARRVIQPK